MKKRSSLLISLPRFASLIGVLCLLSTAPALACSDNHPSQSDFCVAFNEEAHCRCKQKAGHLASYFCTGSMRDLYSLMKAQYGTLQQACRKESSRAPKHCEAKWTHYHEHCERVF